MADKGIPRPDPWNKLRRWTPARIALGRAGGSVPTQALLDFRLAHARAVDAVHQPLNIEEFCTRLKTDDPSLASCVGQIGSLCLTTAVSDHTNYLQRPDLGRVLSEDSREKLEAASFSSRLFDLVIIVVDGLSALAVERQAPPLLVHLLPRLLGSKTNPSGPAWNLAPLMVVRHGRVAVQDQIGLLVGARMALTLIGERPGLVGPDSLSAYLVYGPKQGNTDANRNCVSNIRPDGLKPAAAAARIHYLLTESKRRQLSGVPLKDQSQLSQTMPKQIRG